MTTMQKLSFDDEARLVDLAKEGDERAYEALIDAHRSALHAHCYRMLASVHDADDALQEALIRAWRGLGGFEARSSLRTWLFTIATNSSFDLLKKRSRRELPLDRGRPARAGELPGEAEFDATWIEPYPDRLIEAGEKSPHARYEARESLELAFIAIIQNVPPRQRAVLIMRDVLGYSALETAQELEMTVVAVNSALQRARGTLAERLPATSQAEELRRLGDDAVQQLAHKYSAAIDSGDIPGILALLTTDATWSMPPHPWYYEGVAAIERFHRDDVSQVRWRHRTSSANGQLAVGCYIYDDERRTYVGTVLDVLTIRNGLIGEVTAFFSVAGRASSASAEYLDAVDFASFDLPAEVLD
jgi:RNA polymerase sigma-70 factor (ECF subfamily)